MAQLSIAFCKQLAKARRDKGMTQSALAATVGCTQSAISMLEAGQSTKIANETVEKIASILGVAMPADLAPPLPLPAPAPSPSHAFCPSAFCYSNVPYVINGDLFFWPRQQSGDASRCAVCGEVLERGCPHCGAALSAAGACCTACGGARVTDTLLPETDRESWAAQRRREIAEWLELT